VASNGTPRITWNGKVFAARTEIVRLGDVETSVEVPAVDDLWLRRFIAALVACERIEGASHIAPAHVIEMAAGCWLEKGGTIESWRKYEIELGLTKSKTRPPRSPIQPVMKWTLGGRNDTDGRIGRLSAAFDAWLALGKERPDPTPRNGEPGTSRLAEWLADHGGYQVVAKAHNARLEYEAALKRGTVWVTHAAGIERVYDSKAAAESQNEGPAYEEPAEWWELEGCEPTGAGGYRRIGPETDYEDDSDPLPERIKGVVRPAYHHRPDDQKDYSESKSETTTARQHHPWEYATHNRKYALLIPRASEEWYTPPQVFQAMDCTFDLDPASPGPDVVPWIPAKRNFTLAENGLEQDWGNDFVYLSPPYSKENLPRWLEKFRQHANGVCLNVDRTSARWWQELCANADLILQVNKKIQFLRPPDEPSYSSPAMGHTLAAYGTRGVAALRNAARNGLGALFEPFTKREARIGELERELARLKEQRDGAGELKQDSKQFWRTPPPLYELLDRMFHFDFDACPYPRPEGYNSLEVPWKQVNYINSPFSARRNPEKHGPTDFVRKAIEENRLGKTSFIVVPTMNYVNMLLEAGAEPIALGHVPWLNAQTGEPHPSPPSITGFALWGDRYSAADRAAIMRELKIELAKLNEQW
jgi:DNA N-6-adenine-methyltransferase (Dam)